MNTIQKLSQTRRLAVNLLVSVLRNVARGGSQYAERQTEVYLMRHTDRGYEYELRQEASAQAGAQARC